MKRDTVLQDTALEILLPAFGMDMLKDVPVKSDPNMPMYETHAKSRLAQDKNGWMAWQ